MFDNVNRLFSRRGADNKEINITSSLLEDVSDYDDSSIFDRVDEPAQDLDSYQVGEDDAVINDMLPTIPAIDDIPPEKKEVISSDDDMISAADIDDVIVASSADVHDADSDKKQKESSSSEGDNDDYDDFQEI